MKNKHLWLGIFLLVLCLIFSSCVSGQSSGQKSKPVVGKGSSLSNETKMIVTTLKSRFDFTGQNIQINPNNFLEKETHLNLPFSTVLSEALATEFSRNGAGSISTQDVGQTPLKATGFYIIAGNDVLITVRLRRMGESASTDLAIAEGRISQDRMSESWTKPEFQRISRSLVNLLEFDYRDSEVLNVLVPDFVPGNTAQPELVLGHEMAKYMKDAVAASPIFNPAGNNEDKADAIIKGDYIKVGQQMAFHVWVEDKKSGRHYAGAKISTDINTIPYELKQSTVQSIDDMVKKLTSRIIEKSRTRVAAGGNRVYIGINNFHDSQKKAITPFAQRISQKFKEVLSQKSVFSVTDDPSDEADYLLSGHYYKDKDKVVLSVDLHKFEPGNTGCRKKNIASVQGNLGQQFSTRQSFEADFKGEIDYLLTRLENKAMTRLSCKARNNLVIHKLKFENKKAITNYSDYLNSYLMDYFTSSVYFSPVTNTKEKLSRSLTGTMRKIVPVAQDSEAAVADIAGAKHYISGSFWPTPGGGVKVDAKLYHVNGSIMASEHTQLDSSGVEIDRPKTPPSPIETLPQDRLGVELFTLKGNSNLTYKAGEEIVFCAKASKNVFIQIYASDAQKNVYRIFPNAFEPQNYFLAGEITTIPNARYQSSFKFEVQSPTGNELVFAFASDKRLPDLPGVQEVGNGVQQVNNLSIRQIKDWFAKYASQRGIMLSWDSLPILTKDQ